MGLREDLGTLPSGNVVRLSDDEITKFLRDKYIFSDGEKTRQKRSRNRLALYRDKGAGLIADMVTALFKNLKVRELRKELIAFAVFQNVSKRITNEISRVYASEALRSVSNGNEGYQDVIRVSRQDRKMRALNRYVNFLNESLLWFDIRAGDPVLRVITPDKFYAISHPNDPTHHIGSIVAIESNGVSVSDSSPAYLVITGEEFFQLDKNGRMVAGSYSAHGLGLMPAILVHREEPEDRLLDSDSGEDLISAHLAVALLNVLMMKQSKSAERVAVASGDLSSTPNGQPMDSEVLQSFGEGISLQTLDMEGNGPDAYIRAARSVIKQIASNHGIPESVFDLSYAASSGFEIELKRAQLREVREDQILDYRPIERKLVAVQAEVLRAAGHPSRFDPSGWIVNFGSVQPPRSPKAMLEFFEQSRRMGLMNSADMMMKLNPEFSPEMAEKQLIINARVEASRVQLLRSLNVSPSASIDDPGQDPRENGGLRVINGSE